MLNDISAVTYSFYLFLVNQLHLLKTPNYFCSYTALYTVVSKTAQAMVINCIHKTLRTNQNHIHLQQNWT